MSPDARSIFDGYQAVRHRLPEATFGTVARDITSLMDIVDDADAFVFDAFGVLNVGDTPIPGAAERMDQLRAAGKAIRILSNAASYDHDGVAAKFAKLGMRIGRDEVITSRDAALKHLSAGVWGCIAAAADRLTDIAAATLRLTDDPPLYRRSDGILFLSTEDWTPERQALLSQALQEKPRPVIVANADLAAPRDHGFSLEPGYFGHMLADECEADIRFFGKPFPEVYAMAEASLAGIRPERIVMCGDTLHTDILGAAARGWQTVLVTQDGVFAGLDTQPFIQRSSIIPTFRVGRI